MSVAPAHPLPPPGGEDEEIVALFLAGRLDADRWDHRAHLLVGHHLLATEGGPVAALERLRPLIQAHNARVGLRRAHRRAERVAQTSNGYHETITRYFVGAVHHAAVPVVGLMAEPTLARTAPGRHWSPTALGSPEAVAGWVPTDRAPLPWVWPLA